VSNLDQRSKPKSPSSEEIFWSSAEKNKGFMRRGKTNPTIVLSAGKEGISGRRDNPVSSRTLAPNSSIEKARGKMSRKSLEKKERKPSPSTVGEKI